MRQEMGIYIPTLGRHQPALQRTLKQVVGHGFDVTLVVRDYEFALYQRCLSDMGLLDKVLLLQLPQGTKGIADTRDSIIHGLTVHRWVLMLDDDLDFAVRRVDDPTKFRQPLPKDIKDMLLNMAHRLRGYIHVGIGSREGGNRVVEDVVWNTRMMRVLGYDAQRLQDLMLFFSPMEVMEDFHMTLQLLRRGYDLPVLNRWVSNQGGGSNSAGGCSTFRTLLLQEENAHRLAKLHPGFVKVVRKQTTSAWGGQERTDVMVQWKKARAEEDLK